MNTLLVAFVAAVLPLGQATEHPPKIAPSDEVQEPAPSPQLPNTPTEPAGTCCIGDLDGNGVIGFNDITVCLGAWPGCRFADINFILAAGEPSATEPRRPPKASARLWRSSPSSMLVPGHEAGTIARLPVPPIPAGNRGCPRTRPLQPALFNSAAAAHSRPPPSPATRPTRAQAPRHTRAHRSSSRRAR